MRKRKVSVFVYINLEKIERMRKEGWTLYAIYEELKTEFGEDFSFNTFATSFQRARNKYNEEQGIDSAKKTIKPAKETQANIEKSINTFTTARAIKNSDPWEE